MKKRLPKGTYEAAKRYLRARYSRRRAAELLEQTTDYYNEFVSESPAPGGLNVLRPQYYGGLSVFAFYEAMEGNVSPNDLQKILWSMLLGGGDVEKRHQLRIRFSGTWLQRASYGRL